MIEAIQWTGRNWDEVSEFGEDASSLFLTSSGDLYVRTLEGDMLANFSDWIIKGVRGEFYPCRLDIFEATYEPVLEADE